MFTEIKESLWQFYLEDPRPSLAGFNGRNKITMLASLTLANTRS
ncbi:MAG: hypothetical protein NTY01_17720 [Verrucomicrobia bacterium]|nr:hypothetical protein [Verrucomicrobiota bacterium]